jgi:AcrR family transcriptional regulator
MIGERPFNLPCGIDMYADCATRQNILEAALKPFADGGYSGTSAQEIVASPDNHL